MRLNSLFVLNLQTREEFHLTPYDALFISAVNNAWTTNRENAQGTILRWNGKEITTFNGIRRQLYSVSPFKLMGELIVAIPFDEEMLPVKKIILKGDIATTIREGELLYIKRTLHENQIASSTTCFSPPSSSSTFDSELCIRNIEGNLHITPLLSDITCHREGGQHWIIEFNDSGVRASITATDINKQATAESKKCAGSLRDLPPRLVLID